MTLSCTLDGHTCSIFFGSKKKQKNGLFILPPKFKTLIFRSFRLGKKTAHSKKLFSANSAQILKNLLAPKQTRLPHTEKSLLSGKQTQPAFIVK